MITSDLYSNGLVFDFGNGELSLEPGENTSTRIGRREVIHTVKDGENIFNIAYQYYKDSGRWYEIADRNHLYNPFRELTVGTKLTIPIYV